MYTGEGTFRVKSIIHNLISIDERERARESEEREREREVSFDRNLSYQIMRHSISLPITDCSLPYLHKNPNSLTYLPVHVVKNASSYVSTYELCVLAFR